MARKKATTDDPAPQMIAEAEARERNKYNKKLFGGPWCPIFGWWPDFDPAPPPNSQVGRCLEVIDQAREIWEIDSSWHFLGEEDEYGFHPMIWADSSWPAPEEVSGYPKEYLESARSIFRARHSAFQHIVPSGETLKGRWEDLVSFIRPGGIYGKVDSKVPDYAVLAILALGKARDSLRNLCDEMDEARIEPWLVANVQDALDLVYFAKTMMLEEEAKEAREDAEKAEQSKNYPRKRASEVNIKRGEDRKNICLDLGETLRKKHPEMKKSSIAEIIHKILCQNFRETLRKKHPEWSDSRIEVEEILEKKKLKGKIPAIKTIRDYLREGRTSQTSTQK